MKNPLKAWREETGFTRREASAALAFNYSFYCQIELGMAAPTEALLAGLEHAGRESERCREFDRTEFMLKWGRYIAAQQKKLLGNRRDPPSEARV